MKIEILAASVADAWGKGDDYATLKRLEAFVIPARATVIQRRYDQTKIFPQSLMMTVKFSTISVPESECPCIITGSRSVRSIFKIPKPLIVRADTFFSFLGSANLRESFSQVTPEEVNDIQYRRFSNNELYYTYKDDYAYMLNAPALKEGAVRYIPEDPREVIKLYPECECDCIENGEFSVEESLVEGIWAFLDAKRPQILKESEELKIND